MEGGNGRGGMPRATRVKNKAAAPIQITAEQILREALERQDAEPTIPKQRITDPEELADYRLKKRKGFEDSIRRNRTNIGSWIKYAAWEETQKEFDRARSVYERVIDVEYKNPSIWIKYAEMEMRLKNVNAARNIFDRAVTLLPRVDQFWLKYSYLENILGNFPATRQIFERWMDWQPDSNAWMTYVRFEIRCGEVERARKIYQRFVQVHPSVQSWLKFAKFEERFDPSKAREVYEAAIEVLGEEANDERLFISFAKFEEHMKEVERARAIYKYALDHIPKKDAQELYKMWISFEKKNGDRTGIEEVIIGKRRFQYEEEIKNTPSNYDVWFDYARLEETYGEVEKVREVYERAIANKPPATEKRFWRRYIYLWINYALFEELEAKDLERAQAVWKECIKNIPHKVFSFSKIWIMAAQFELRQKKLTDARKTLGIAMGLAPKPKVFEAYIEFEQQLGNIDRCRTIFEKWLEWSPSNCECWIKFASLERDLGEFERARAIFELAVAQPLLDMPEVLWKSYIDFEIEIESYDNARGLFRRLLERTKHVKVWISFAEFEISLEAFENARRVFAEGFEALKSMGSSDDSAAALNNKEERVMLIQSWKRFEEENGQQKHLDEVIKRLPKRVIKKRQIKTEDGIEAGWEEYYDYIFPGEETQANLKLLERAKLWKKQGALE